MFPAHAAAPPPLSLPDARWDAAIIGGGFYGASVALELRKRVDRVVILERESGLLRRASYANQARVHNGYHYPRSILTSIRSRLSYGRFREEFPEAVDSSFTKVYAIARRLSKINAQQFMRFCQRIGADVAPAPEAIVSLFNPHLIEAAFVVTECAFNARVVEASLVTLLREAGVAVMLDTEVHRLQPLGDSEVRVDYTDASGNGVISAEHAFNCTYSGINRLLAASGLPTVPLKHELAELALIDMPPSLARLGITVMDGPFFSTMPFPAGAAHSLSHVRFTPHRTWSEANGEVANTSGSALLGEPPPTNYRYMLQDAVRYVPQLSGARFRESLWEIKTILPRSERDDSRPVLLHRSSSAPRIWSVLGAKIDGVYDVQAMLNEVLDTQPAR